MKKFRQNHPNLVWKWNIYFNFEMDNPNSHFRVYLCSQNTLKILFGKTKFWMHAFLNGKNWCGKTDHFQMFASKMYLNRWTKWSLNLRLEYDMSIELDYTSQWGTKNISSSIFLNTSYNLMNKDITDGNLNLYLYFSQLKNKK